MKNSLKRFVSRVMAVVIAVSCCLSNVFVSAYADTRNIDVWDFGFVAESESYYTNNITSDNYLAFMTSIGGTGGLIPESLASGTIDFGDLSLSYIAKDRFYNTSSNTYGTAGKSYSDTDYTSNGYYYCNGNGGDSRRCFYIKDVKAGDVIYIYSGWSNTPSGDGDSVVFRSGSYADGTFTADGVQNDTSDPFTASAKNTFIATEAADYQLYMTTAGGGKPVTFRVMRIPAITVSGTVSGVLPEGTYGIKFQNQTTLEETAATMDGNTYTASLSAGYTYKAVMTGVVGYGVTNATKNVTVSLSDVATGTLTADLTSEVKTSYTLSGSFTGFASDYDTSNLILTLTPTDNDESDTQTIKVGTDLTYSAQLDSGVTYAASMTGVNDYEITDGGTIFFEEGTANTQDITVATVATYSVSGGFLGLTQTRGEYETLNVTPTAITFTNVDDGYVYSGTCADGAYSASLRDGAYSVAVTLTDYQTTNHVVVNGGAVTKSLLLEYTGAAEAVEYSSDIYVGPSRTYTTLQAAVDAVGNMTRSNNERVTIHIDPGTYRAQTIIDVPNITIVNDSEDEDVVLTWYYGIGYNYYSCHNGYYDPYYDYDQYEKGAASRWGAATYVKSNGTGFKAENIYFEASFNKYMTDEEVADGVELADDAGLTTVRTISTDVTTRAATERSAAFAIEADDSEFLGCTFYGSQDTLYTGGGTVDVYYKNCKIIGQTDFIFGDGNCVFDGCELQWAGYSSGTTGGYLTAAKDDAANGYLFRGCIVTGQEDEDSSMVVTGGNFGRPWGAGAKVTFANTKLSHSDYIASAGWADMSGNTPANANFKEYNTTYLGEAVDTSGRVVSALTSLDTSVYNALSFLNGFVPTYYAADQATTPEFTTDPYLTSNGDLNAPNIGNTLTVNYELNTGSDTDVSRIDWYRVDTSGTEELILTTAANVSPSYQALSADAGCYLKAYVTPMTIDGYVGETKSIIMANTLSSTWVDPANPNEPEPGTGINVFLAGDSTVKDYSANGMYNGGSIEDKGSWGEFLQDFLDEDYVTVLNYANGGRSTRNFMNEGSLAKIEAAIGEGDYFFIQFGHNDCANQSGYLADRYVPLGEPDANGIYPTTGPADGYTVGNYTYDCGATFKWYLLQYINVARDAGATPVLVTPVSRRQFNSDGTIKNHHDSTDTTTGTQVTSGNAYVEAYYQLAEEENVLLIDGFELTKTLLEKAYADDPDAASGSSPYANVLFCAADGTHYSKTGGVIQAGQFAEAIKALGVTLSNYVISPSGCEGISSTGLSNFTITKTGNFTAFDNDFVYSEYWSTYGQELFDSLSVDTGDDDDDPTVDPTEPTESEYDLNGDGVVDSKDADEILLYTLNKYAVSDSFDETAADINGDGIITALDASLLAQMVLDGEV